MIGGIRECLPELIERVEGGTGSDRELDLAIIKTIYPFALVSRYNPDTETNEPYTHHDPTASLDSVVTLLEARLPGWAWCVANSGEEDKDSGCLTETAEPYRDFVGNAHSPARALLAACLRAIQAQAGTLADANNKNPEAEHG